MQQAVYDELKGAQAFLDHLNQQLSAIAGVTEFLLMELAQPSFAQHSYSNSLWQSPYTKANKILAVSSRVAQILCFPVAAAKLLGHQAH